LLLDLGVSVSSIAFFTYHRIAGFRAQQGANVSGCAKLWMWKMWKDVKNTKVTKSEE